MTQNYEDAISRAETLLLKAKGLTADAFLEIANIQWDATHRGLSDEKYLAELMEGGAKTSPLLVFPVCPLLPG